MKRPVRFLRDPSIARLLAQALKEDLGRGDLSSRLIVPPDRQAVARLEAREAGIMAGGPLLGPLFRRLDPRLRIQNLWPDGRRFRAGQVLARLKGSARALLAGERLALNLLQRLCGIATVTAAYVAAARRRAPRVQLLDTRKTTPGLRLLEKYAVACGGGVNHRLCLDDAVLIKDNHLKVAGSVEAAVRAARRGGRPVQVEVESLAELEQALAAGADGVLLDNFNPARLRAAVRRVALFRRKSGRPVFTEASGGVTLKRVGALAAAGVDRISVGALTHSVRALDLALEFEAQ